jgi:hypothetical protein
LSHIDTSSLSLSPRLCFPPISLSLIPPALAIAGRSGVGVIGKCKRAPTAGPYSQHQAPAPTGYRSQALARCDVAVSERSIQRSTDIANSISGIFAAHANDQALHLHLASQSPLVQPHRHVGHGSPPLQLGCYAFLDPSFHPLLLLTSAPLPRLMCTTPINTSMPPNCGKGHCLCYTPHRQWRDLTGQSACGFDPTDCDRSWPTCLPQVRSSTGSTKVPRPPSVTSMRRARSTTPTRFQITRSTTPPRVQRY